VTGSCWLGSDFPLQPVEIPYKYRKKAVQIPGNPRVNVGKPSGEFREMSLAEQSGGSHERP